MAEPSPADLLYMKEHINDSKVANVLATNVITIVIAIVAVSLRFFARYLGDIHRGWDDWFILAALVSFLSYIISYSVTVHYGMGRHVILIKSAKGFGASAIATQCSYEAVILCIKFSILFLYSRIFPQRWFRIVLIAMGIFILANNTAQFLVNLFQCVPISYNWNPHQKGHCVNFGVHVLAEGIINILTDWTILALPIRVLWNLKMSRTRKIQLSAMFLSGGIVCIVSIVRLFYVLKVATVDPTWNDVEGSLISAVECCVGILAACLPTYRILVHGKKEESSTQYYDSWPSSFNKRKNKTKTSIKLSEQRSGDTWKSLPTTTSQDDQERLYGTSLKVMDAP